MRKTIVVLLALSLSGCASLKTFETAISIATTPVGNPITEERLENTERLATLVFIGLKRWKSACKQGVLPSSCRQQVATVQTYTRQIPPYLKQLRVFVKTNDQVNAIQVFGLVRSLIDTARTRAAEAGREIGGV